MDKTYREMFIGLPQKELLFTERYPVRRGETQNTHRAKTFASRIIYKRPGAEMPYEFLLTSEK